MPSIKPYLRKIIPVRASVFEKVRKANEKQLGEIRDGVQVCSKRSQALLEGLRDMESNTASSLESLRKAIDSSSDERKADQLLDYAKLSTSMASIGLQLARMEDEIKGLSLRLERIERATGVDDGTVFRL